MMKSLIGAVIGAIVGAIVGVLVGAQSYQLGDTSSIASAGKGIIAIFGVGLGAVAGAIVGSASAILDANSRGRHAE